MIISECSFSKLKQEKNYCDNKMSDFQLLKMKLLGIIIFGIQNNQNYKIFKFTSRLTYFLVSCKIDGFSLNLEKNSLQSERALFPIIEQNGKSGREKER